MYRESREEIWRIALGKRLDSADAPRPRASRARDQPETPRVVSALSLADERMALAALAVRPVRAAAIRRAGGERDDWISGVWLELVNPPEDVVQPIDLGRRIDRAVWRFEKNLRTSCRFIYRKRSLPSREGA